MDFATISPNYADERAVQASFVCGALHIPFRIGITPVSSSWARQCVRMENDAVLRIGA